MEFLRNGANSNICCVCLIADENARSITDCEKVSEQWISQLQRVLPEVEWLEWYKICGGCCKSLAQILTFRQNCIQLHCGGKLMKSELLDFKKESNVDLVDSEPILNESTVKPVNFKEPLTCYYCQATFTGKLVLAVHLHKRHKDKLNEQGKPHKCEKCGEVYSVEKMMLRHASTCDGTKKLSNRRYASYRCCKCHKCFTDRATFIAHPKHCSETDQPTNRFSCEVCGLQKTNSKLVVEHCKSEHNMDPKTVKPYLCDECPNRFSSSTNYIQHKKYHNGSRSHICHQCGKSFITKSDLTVHEYTHLNRRNYKCNFCDKAFNTNKNLRSHNLVVHTDSKQWKYGCEICKKRFPLKSGYDQHMRRHTGDKRFTCLICEKTFVSNSELQKHIKFHSKVKPFRCSHCDKCYKERKLYEIHLTRAHGIGDAKIPVRTKKFACHVCPNTFFDKQKLTRHLCTHTGDKPFTCNYCDKKFTDKSYLKQHLKTVHSVNSDEYSK